MESQNLITAPELALILTCSPSTIYSMAKRRQIPHFKIGDRVVFSLTEVLVALRKPADESEDFKIPKIAVASGRG
jgi:excisionase family DNA binding protein